MNRAIAHATRTLVAVLLSACWAARAETPTPQPPGAGVAVPVDKPKRVQTSRIYLPHVDAQTAVVYDDPPTTDGFHAGTVVWRLVSATPPELPAIRGEILVPTRFTMTLTLTRDTDPQATGAEMIEITVSPQPGATHGPVVGIQGLFATSSQEARGDPLIGRYVTTAANHFLYSLSTFPGDVDRNSALLRKQAWLYVPIVDEDGHRAALSLAKGAAGERVFDDAIDAWQKADAGGTKGTHAR